MKEAAGEANLTVVAIILIAVIVAVGTPLINSLMKSSAYRTCCTDSGAVWKNGNCSLDTNTEGYDDMETEYMNCQQDSKLSDIHGFSED